MKISQYWLVTEAEIFSNLLIFAYVQISQQEHYFPPPTTSL